MKKFLIVSAMSLSMSLCLAAQAEGDKAPKESKMGLCHKDAKAQGLKGDERKAFMKECLSAKGSATTTAKSSTSQTKHKACSAEAKGFKGDERKEKMNACMNG